MTSGSGEETPLLGPKRGDDADASYQRRVVTIIFIMVILVDLAGFFQEAPQTKILEGIICNRHYVGAPGEHDCTVGPVQSELATVTQMLNTFNRLPGLIVAIPFGILADRYGRRPILLLAILGALLQDIFSKIVLWHPEAISPRFIWLSSAALLVGGGDAVSGSMVYLVVADVAPPQQRASLFFLVTACGLIAEVVATPLSALLMARDPWIPYFMYSGLTFLGGTIPLLFLPETLPKPSPGAETSPCDTSEDEGQEQSAASDTAPFLPPQSTVASKFRPLVKRNVVAILLAFFVSALGRQSTSFLLQFIRQRFNWTYEKASLLITLRAAINLALLLVALPALNRFLTRRGLSAPGKDLLISRVSVACFTLGSLVISVAPAVALAAIGIAIFALGSGFTPAARSLVTTFVHQDEAGLLYSALAIMQSVGGLVAGPLLALTFRWGLSLGSEWTGIPFAAVAGLFACSFLATSLVRL
ncbi:hypothetical protein N8I77_009328 [Diaporthe amygdali]|uniref:Major facilitator superfamily (MFS) profile domain-containing protein n=1 Tax=Phomopsis amygdali TaxID=1214568 RepID=A0AAD9W0K8_PHOAM|nr:hypothetical protein N8I77_009328 [Diaporthe amygdali]